MKALLALILAATLSSAAHSAIISFPNNPIIPGEPGPVIAVNFVDTGFRFSPAMSKTLTLLVRALVTLVRCMSTSLASPFH
jgi:hypothetical protein